METLIIHYEKTNKAARKLIEAVKASGYFTIDKKHKTGLQKATSVNEEKRKEP